MVLCIVTSASLVPKDKTDKQTDDGFHKYGDEIMTYPVNLSHSCRTAVQLHCVCACARMASTLILVRLSLYHVMLYVSQYLWIMWWSYWSNSCR